MHLQWRKNVCVALVNLHDLHANIEVLDLSVESVLNCLDLPL